MASLDPGTAAPSSASLDPRLWAASVRRNDDGALEVAGQDVRELAERWGTPAYLMDEEDFRRRARSFRTAFSEAFGDTGADVFYAGKAFLCTAVARWVGEEGLSLDVCTGGELAVAVRAGLPGERIALHGNNKGIDEIEAALRHRVSRVVLDSFDEIERVTDVATRLGVVAPVMVRVTTGVEAHTHEYVATAHEDQKFGFSLAGGRAAEAVDRVLQHHDRLRLLGLHSHIGSQIFDLDGFEVAATRLVGLHADIAERHGTELAELDLGGGFGIAYGSDQDPLTPEELAQGLADVVRRECAARSLAVPRISVEPGRAVVGPTTFTLYRVGTVKRVGLDGGLSRTYVAVDGGMSDNIRPALYGADYSCVLADRTGTDESVLARVVGKHCETGDVVVRDTRLPADVAPGDLVAVPGTGAYCRSLASQYNHVARPPVVALRDGQGRAIVRRETIDDLLALDAD